MFTFTQEKFDLDRTVRLVINCVFFIGIVWLIHYLRGVLLPFLVGCLIAYLFEPFVQFNRELLRLKGRMAAVFVTLFEVAFFLLAVCWIVFPLIARESAQMAEMLKQYSSTRSSIPFVPEEVHEFLRRNLDFEFLASKLTRDEWKRMIEEGLSASWTVLTGSISIVMSVMSWAIVVLYVVFIMLDYERISKGFKRIVRPKYRPLVTRIGGDLKSSMNRYFRGQALVCLIVGILFSIGFSIVGLPMAIVLGLFIGLLNMVPYLQLISIPIAVLLCLVSSVGGGTSFWTLFWETMAVYIVVQMLQDLIVTPKVIGKAMSLNPALIFLSLSIWGSLLGMIGLIIAIPLTTLLLSYYDQYISDDEEPDEELHTGEVKRE